MASEGYIRLPRSLTQNPLWKDLPPTYKEVFLTILEHVVFRTTKFDDHGVIVELKPGQLCTSIRDFQKYCSKHITKNDIERSIKKFVLYGFIKYSTGKKSETRFDKNVRQKVRQQKSVITISHKETYELILKASETESETKLRQLRDIKEECKERKEEEIEKIYKKENSSFDSKQVPIEVLAATGTEQHNIHYHDNAPDNITYIIPTSLSEKPKKSKKKYKKENFLSDDIIEFPPHVWMPKKEYDSLVNDIGEPYAKYHISEINQYIEAGNNAYDCYSQAVRNFHKNAKAWKTLPTLVDLNKNVNNQTSGEPRFKARVALKA